MRTRITTHTLAAAAVGIFGGSTQAETVSLNFERPMEPVGTHAEGTPGPPGTLGTPEVSDAQVSTGVTPSLRFLDKGWWGWSVGGGVAFNSASTDTNLVLTFHTFIVKGFEFNFGLGGWYDAQDEDGDNNEKAEDALGINPAFGVRWHFWTPEAPEDRSWSVYADAGIGVVFTDEDVPPGGTKFNFTPRAGLGATFQLSDAGARFDVGVRWAHVSNASTSGTDDNPSRDSPMVYVGVMFPF